MAQTTAPFNTASSPDEEPWGLWNVISSGDVGGTKRILAAYPDAWKISVKEAEGFKKGDQAIHVAARGDTPEIVDYLLSLGATLEDKNTVTGETPLMASLGSTLTMPKHFIEKGANKNARDFEKRTALHLAAKKGYAVTAKALAEAKFDLEARDENGNTPLLLALLERNSDAATALLEQGAKVDTPGAGGKYPLDIAFRNFFDAEEPWLSIYQVIRERSAEEKLKTSIASANIAAQALKHGNGRDVTAPAKATFRPKIKV